MPNFTVILAAAGKSSRFKDDHYKKPYINLNRKAVWLHSAERFLKRNDVKQLIVVIAEGDHEDFTSRFGPNMAVLGIDLVIGGQERCDSVNNALAKVDDASEYVAIHDAARPCVSDEDIEAVFEAATKNQAAILATQVTSTLKRSEDGHQIAATSDRNGLWQALTPQVFAKDLLVAAYKELGDHKPTDDAQAVELAGHTVSIVSGSPLNIKITTKEDLALAGACLEAMPKPKFDAPAHPFKDDTLWR